MTAPDASASAACLWCGGPRTLRFSVRADWRLPESTPPREVYWCDACDAGSVFPLPQPEEVPSFYPEGYYTHADGLAANEAASLESKLRQHLAWRLNREVADTPELLRCFLPELDAIEICDLGCGNGLALRPFREAGVRVVGVEPDDRARAVAARELDEVHAGTAESLPEALNGRQFSCVRLFHSLEHCVDPARALDRAVELIAPGGVLVLEVPNCASRGFRTQLGSWPWTDLPRHLHFLTETALRRACAARGLEVEALNYRGFARQFTDGWLADERRMHAALHPEDKPVPVKRRAWAFLLAGAFLPRPAKYDSVYLIARRAAE